jgi:hypothetical protein
MILQILFRAVQKKLSGGGGGVRTNKATLPSVYLITNTLRVYIKLYTRYRGVQSCILNVTEMNTV